LPLLPFFSQSSGLSYNFANASRHESSLSCSSLLLLTSYFCLPSRSATVLPRDRKPLAMHEWDSSAGTVVSAAKECSGDEAPP
jgi:hypothetical protein